MRAPLRGPPSREPSSDSSFSSPPFAERAVIAPGEAQAKNWSPGETGPVRSAAWRPARLFYSPPTADQGPIERHDLRVNEHCSELTDKGEPEQDKAYPRPPGSPSPEPSLDLCLAGPTLHAPRCLH